MNRKLSNMRKLALKQEFLIPDWKKYFSCPLANTNLNML